MHIINNFSSIIFCNFSVHVVFGEVISGQDLVRQLEDLPVDRNSRPLQDAVISNCGELVRQLKGNSFFIDFLTLKWLFLTKILFSYFS